MSESDCQFYQPWEDHGVRIAQCLEYWQGDCHEALSPHDGQPCPWPNGYPCPARNDQAAPLTTPFKLWIKEEPHDP